MLVCGMSDTDHLMMIHWVHSEVVVEEAMLFLWYRSELFCAAMI